MENVYFLDYRGMDPGATRYSIKVLQLCYKKEGDKEILVEFTGLEKASRWALVATLKRYGFKVFPKNGNVRAVFCQ